MPKKKIEAAEPVAGEAESAPVEEPRPARVRNEAVAEMLVPFKSWFIMKLNQEPRLKPHHADGVFVYFQGRGLKEEDSARRYDAALKEYFGG